MINREDFKEMIRDWQADSAPEMDDLLIGEPELNDEGMWEVDAEDDKCNYMLVADGENITIHYLSTKQGGKTMKSEFLKGTINGFTAVKHVATGEYILETNGDPVYSECDSFEDIFGDMTPEEFDSHLEPTTVEELEELQSMGISEWVESKL